MEPGGNPPLSACHDMPPSSLRYNSSELVKAYRVWLSLGATTTSKTVLPYKPTNSQDVLVGVSVGASVRVGVAVNVDVRVRVAVCAEVRVGVFVGAAVSVDVRVGVAVGVDVRVGVAVSVDVRVGVAVCIDAAQRKPKP